MGAAPEGGEGGWSWGDTWDTFEDWLRDESNAWDPAPVRYEDDFLTVPNAQHLDAEREAEAREAERSSQEQYAGWEAERDKPLIPQEWIDLAGLGLGIYVAVKLLGGKS
jgi:hypothetical protein